MPTLESSTHTRLKAIEVNLSPAQPRSVMCVLGRIRHDIPAPRRHDRFLEHAPASIGDDLCSYLLEDMPTAGFDEFLVDRSAGGDDEGECGWSIVLLA